MTITSSGPEVILLRGTLFIVPDAGHVRLPEGAPLTFTAKFPFRVEFAQLLGDPAPIADQVSRSGTGPGYSVTVTLPACGASPPSYKYTIKGDGEAAGKVLDPIIIVDRKPGSGGH